MTERDEALCDMDKAARELIRLIKRERDAASGGSSWDAVEAVLLDLREAWEGAKAYEILAYDRRQSKSASGKFW